MRRVHSLAVALLLLLCSVARGEWRVVSAEAQGKGAGGVVYLKTQVEDSATNARATLHFGVFDTKNATLRVIDDAGAAHSSLAETMARENCVAGVNGGYFDPEHAPIGLLINDGRVVVPKQKARLLSGVVSVVNGRLQIQRAAEYAPKTKPAAARQCGPFLVERAKPVPGLNDTRAARRTFVVSNGAEQAAIGYSSHLTLAQLAHILATPRVAADLKIQRALNMDGGSSSGFYFKGENGPFTLREQKTVRDYLGVVPK